MTHDITYEMAVFSELMENIFIMSVAMSKQRTDTLMQKRCYSC